MPIAHLPEHIGDQGNRRILSVAAKRSNHGIGALPGNNSPLLAELCQDQLVPVEFLFRYNVHSNVRIERPSYTIPNHGHNSSRCTDSRQQTQMHTGSANLLKHFFNLSLLPQTGIHLRKCTCLYFDASNTANPGADPQSFNGLLLCKRLHIRSKPVFFGDSPGSGIKRRRTGISPGSIFNGDLVFPMAKFVFARILPAFPGNLLNFLFSELHHALSIHMIDTNFSQQFHTSPKDRVGYIVINNQFFRIVLNIIFIDQFPNLHRELQIEFVTFHHRSRQRPLLKINYWDHKFLLFLQTTPFDLG